MSSTIKETLPVDDWHPKSTTSVPNANEVTESPDITNVADLHDLSKITINNAMLSPLLNSLPRELRDKIYSQVLVHSEPIEFAPLEQWRSDVFRERLNAYQYQQALRFRQEIRPAFPFLRVCKQVHAEATPLFYGKNSFRFSNPTGWFILDRFLKLIGPDNCLLLRNITICHPALGLGPGDCPHGSHFLHNQADYCDLLCLYDRYMSPFCLVKDFEYGTVHEDRVVSRPELCEPGTIDIESILGKLPNLQSLHLLVHTHMRATNDYGGGECWREAFFHQYIIEPISDEYETSQHRLPRLLKSSGISVSLVNLIPRQPSCGTPFKFEILTDAPALRALGPGELKATQIEARVVKYAKSNGWQVRQMEYGDCGYYPLQADHKEMHHEPCDQCAVDVEAHWCRKQFEVAVQEANGLPVWWEDCVQCWKRNCVCKDGGAFIGDDWYTDVDVVGNPGVLIKVDARKKSGLNVTR